MSIIDSHDMPVLAAGETRRNIALRLSLIGEMHAVSHGNQNVLPLGRKTRALLAILALSAPRPMSRSRLAELLWSRRLEEQARASLRQEIHRLLEALQPAGDVLRVTRDHVCLRLDLAWVDVEDVLHATVTNPGALSLIKGELLEEFNGVDPALDQWLMTEREKLRDHARIIAEALLAQQSTPDMAIPIAQQLLRIDRAHEGAWRALVRAHAERGERGLAIQTYERCRIALAEALDAAPSQETQRLVAEIRAGALASAASSANAYLESPKRGPPARPGVVVGVLPPQLSGPSVGMADFALDLAEDMAAALLRFPHLTLVPSSSLAQASRDAGTLRRVIGLDFVLDGTLRSANGRVRVTLRLLDLREDNRLVWTHHFDVERDDAFELHDDLVAQVAAQITPEIESAESQRAAQQPEEHSSAYDLVLRALPLTSRLVPAEFDEAESMLRRALVLDPEFVAAHSNLAFHLAFRVSQGWAADDAETVAEARQHAERAIVLDPLNARAFSVAGHIRAALNRCPLEALELHSRAISLNPNMAMIWGLAAITYTYLGDMAEADVRFERYRRLAPTDTNAFLYDSARVLLELQRGNYPGAIEYGRRTSEVNPNFVAGRRHYLAALGHAGRTDEAARVMEHLLALDPRLTLKRAIDQCPLELPAARDLYADGLQKAGLH